MYRSKLILRKVVAIAICLAGITVFSGCKEENPNGNDTISDNYYVKYVIKGTCTYCYFRDWTATTPGGTYTNSGYQTKSWNQTYGPVKKGFKCEIQVGNYIGGTPPTIEIYVSKNQEPFALKTTNTGQSASYTIQ